LALRMEDAVPAVLHGMPATLKACLFDRTGGTLEFLGGDASCREGPPRDVRLSTLVDLPFAQRQWALQLWTTATTEAGLGQQGTAWLFAIAGVGFAAALGALLLMVTGNAERMSAAMEEA